MNNSGMYFLRQNYSSLTRVVYTIGYGAVFRLRGNMEVLDWCGETLV